MSVGAALGAGTSKECRLRHRVGSRGLLIAGGEQWECTNDRACRRRVEQRAQAVRDQSLRTSATGQRGSARSVTLAGPSRREQVDARAETVRIR